MKLHMNNLIINLMGTHHNFKHLKLNVNFQLVFALISLMIIFSHYIFSASVASYKICGAKNAHPEGDCAHVPRQYLDANSSVRGEQGFVPPRDFSGCQTSPPHFCGRLPQPRAPQCYTGIPPPLYPSEPSMATFQCRPDMDIIPPQNFNREARHNHIKGDKQIIPILKKCVQIHGKTKHHVKFGVEEFVYIKNLDVS